MEKIIRILILLAAIPLLAWTPIENISNTPGDSRYPSIEIIDTSRIHVIWSEKDPWFEYLYHTYYDGGSWRTPKTFSGTQSTGPANTSWNGFSDLLVIWVGDLSTSYQVMYSNNFPAWKTESLGTSVSNCFGTGTVCGSAGMYPAVLYPYGCGTEKILKFRESDGSSWSPPTNLGIAGKDNIQPQMDFDSCDMLWAFWACNEYGYYNIYYSTKIPIDTWYAPDIVADTAGDSLAPRIHVSGCDVHLVFQDDVDGTNNIYYTKKSIFSWTDPVVKIYSSPYDSIDPDITVDSMGYPHVVFAENRPFLYQIYHMKFDGTSWTKPELISKNGENAMRPRVTMTWPNICHVVWENDTGGLKEIYYTSDYPEIPALNRKGIIFLVLIIILLIPKPHDLRTK